MIMHSDYKEMPAASVEPDAISHNAAISACERGSRKGANGVSTNGVTANSLLSPVCQDSLLSPICVERRHQRVRARLPGGATCLTPLV